MEHIGPAYGAALQSGVPALIALLDAEMAARDSTAVPSPSWRCPGRMGRCRDLQPLGVD